MYTIVFESVADMARRREELVRGRLRRPHVQLGEIRQLFATQIGGERDYAAVLRQAVLRHLPGRVSRTGATCLLRQ